MGFVGETTLPSGRSTTAMRRPSEPTSPVSKKPGADSRIVALTVVLPPFAEMVTVSPPTAASSGTSTVTDSVPPMFAR